MSTPTSNGTSKQPQSLGQFISGAAKRGPVVGLCTSDAVVSAASDDTSPVDATVVTVDGRSMATVDDLMDTFAAAWDFPSYFGRNRDAFDECMRELEPTTAQRILLTHITNASLLLRTDADQLGWFVDSLQFYRRHYRDIADDPATFAVLLSTHPDTVSSVESRWADVGVPLPEIAVPETAVDDTGDESEDVD